MLLSPFTAEITQTKSAQNFRKRQKQHAEELEKKVRLLSEENSILKQKVVSLTANNSVLNDQLSKVWSLVHKAFTFAVPYTVKKDRTEENTF